MRITKIGLGFILGSTLAMAQNPPRPSFDVASIRPSPTGGLPPGAMAGLRIDGAQLRTTFLTLKDYIGLAYRLKLYQISGPDWVGADRFDVAATLPD